MLLAARQLQLLTEEAEYASEKLNSQNFKEMAELVPKIMKGADTIPCFIDLMLRRQLVRIVLLAAFSRDLSSLTSDPTFSPLFHRKLDDYPPWLFQRLDRADQQVLDADALIGFHKRELVNNSAFTTVFRKDYEDYLQQERQTRLEHPEQEEQKRTKPIRF